jgi:ribose transport system permease protein
VPYSDIPSVLVNLSQGRASFFPYLLIVTAVTTALVGVGLYWLPAGRSLLAVGGNREAAVLSGLSRNSSLLLAHGASGLLAAIAAVMYIGVLQSATPATGGDWLIVSFAVPIIGGTALTGGEASSVGTVAAAIVLAAINDALIVLNVNTNAVEMAEGLLIFAAVLAGRFGQSAGTSRSGYGRMLARQSRKQVSPPAAAGPARA